MFPECLKSTRFNYKNILKLSKYEIDNFPIDHIVLEVNPTQHSCKCRLDKFQIDQIAWNSTPPQNHSNTSSTDFKSTKFCENQSASALSTCNLSKFDIDYLLQASLNMTWTNFRSSKLCEIQSTSFPKHKLGKLHFNWI